MEKILVATDFSERSDRALRRATLLAKQFGASMSIIHVVDDDQPSRIVISKRDAATALLRELQTTVREIDGVACDASVALAAPFVGIVRAVEQMSPDILVVGHHRRQVLRDVFVGTTAERTIRSVACPVLMVNAPPVGRYRRIMLTTDLSESARHVLRTLRALDIGQGAALSILHVFESPLLHHAMMQKDDRQECLEEDRNTAVRLLSEFVASTDAEYMNQIVCHQATSPAKEILGAAKARAADLVVMGTHSRNRLAKFFLGSVAEEVLRAADRDVLTVPPAA